MTPHSPDTIPAADRPLFSVIVPFLNEQQWLPKCLATLRAKARRDPSIARNRGILAARGRYIALLDADCLAEPDWLEAMQRELTEADAAILLGYLAYPEPRSLALQLHEDYEDAKLRQVLECEPSACWFGHAGNMVVRADVFKEIGLFEPMPVVGDTEIIHRLRQRQHNAVVRYAAAARVVHAEVDSFRMCLTKTYEIGAHSETLARVSPYRDFSRGATACCQPVLPHARLRPRAMARALGHPRARLRGLPGRTAHPRLRASGPPRIMSVALDFWSPDIAERRLP